MNMLKRIVDTVILFAMLLPVPAWAQQAAGSSIGTVTALQGQATVGRVALPQPTSMKFRDDVFFRDQITTKEQSTLRLLLGGKGVLTIREQSQVTLDESVAPTGERRSVLSLLGGKIAAAVARSLMRPGEEVEIRTPNAVAAVRGTVLIAEYNPPRTSAEAPKPILLASGDPTFRVAQATTPAAGQTTFLVLTGSVTVIAQGAPPVTVGALQTVSVTGSATGAQVGAVQTATQAQVAQATQGLQMEKSLSGEGDGKAAQAQAQLAATLANAIVQATSDATAPPPPPFQQPSTTPVPDVTEIPPLPTTIVQDELPSGPLLQLNALTMAVPAGTTVMKFGPGSANAVVPIGVTGTGMESTVIALSAAGTFDITGNTRTHSGPLLGLSAAALVTTDINTPVMQVNGTTFTSSGPLVSLTGGSILFLSGPLLDITNGTLNAAGQPLMLLDSNNGFFTNTAAPAVRVSNGSLTAGALLWTTGTGNFGILSGPALEGNNADITLSILGGDAIDIEGSNGIIENLGPGVPFVRLTNSNLTLTEAGEPLIDPGGNSSPAYAGVGLIATNTSGVPKTISVNGPLLRLWGVDLLDTAYFIQLSNMTVQTNGPAIEVMGFNNTSTAAGPLLGASGSTMNVNGQFLRVHAAATLIASATGGLLQFSGSQVNVSDSLLMVGDGSYLGGPRAHMELSGALIETTGSSLAVGGSLVRIDPSGFFRSTTTNPLIGLAGGTHNIGSGTSGIASLLDYTGDTIDTGTGLGMTTLFGTGGPYLGLNAATVNLGGSGNAIKVDTAVLDATGPIIAMLNSTLNTSPTGDATNGAVHLYRSTVTALGPMIGLDNSQVTVQNGPMLTLTGGSQLTVTGDLATLANGSRLTVVNGPLIRVDGINAQGRASNLSVSGALVNFVGSGNQIIVNNAIASTGTIGGISVHNDGKPGSSISLVSPVKNPLGGTLSGTGVYIQVTNGGQVATGTGF